MEQNDATTEQTPAPVLQDLPMARSSMFSGIFGVAGMAACYYYSPAFFEGFHSFWLTGLILSMCCNFIAIIQGVVSTEKYKYSRHLYKSDREASAGITLGIIGAAMVLPGWGIALLYKAWFMGS